MGKRFSLREPVKPQETSRVIPCAHVVIDTPPGEPAIIRSAMLAAYTDLIPIPPSGVDLDQLSPTLEVLAKSENMYSPQVFCQPTHVRTRSSRAA